MYVEPPVAVPVEDVPAFFIFKFQISKFLIFNTSFSMMGLRPLIEVHIVYVSVSRTRCYSAASELIESSFVATVAAGR